MRVGVAQIEPRLGELEHNRALAVAQLERAAELGCDLVVLPECASSGYVFEGAEEALAFAEEVPGPYTDALASACRRLGLHCVSGMLGREGDVLYNTAVLVGPDGLLGRYRKTHLPFLGVDRFAAAGDELPVFDTPLGRIGLLICYDIRFPEAMRALALRGAELVAHPTNWPLAGVFNAEVLTRARAQESRIFLATANRVGTERYTTFCGWSQVCDPNGDRLVEAGRDDVGVFAADVDLDEARSKALVPIPGVHEMELFADRRPDLYGPLVAENAAVARR